MIFKLIFQTATFLVLSNLVVFVAADTNLKASDQITSSSYSPLRLRFQLEVLRLDPGGIDECSVLSALSFYLNPRGLLGNLSSQWSLPEQAWPLLSFDCVYAPQTSIFPLPPSSDIVADKFQALLANPQSMRDLWHGLLQTTPNPLDNPPVTYLTDVTMDEIDRMTSASASCRFNPTPPVPLSAKIFLICVISLSILAFFGESFALISFIKFPSIRRNRLSHISCMILLGNALISACLVIIAYVTLLRLSPTFTLAMVVDYISLVGLFLVIIWNFILALHIIIELRYPSLLDWPYLFIVYHLCGGLGSLGLAVLPIIPSVQKDQLIAPSDQSFVVEFYVLCVLIGLSAITAIASFIAVFRASGEKESSLCPRIHLLLRTSSFTLLYLTVGTTFLFLFAHEHVVSTAPTWLDFLFAAAAWFCFSLALIFIWFTSTAFQSAYQEWKQARALQEMNSEQAVAVKTSFELIVATSIDDGNDDQYQFLHESYQSSLSHDYQ